ncbi:MAG: hypothetical protein EXR77_06695 [Myxococcales bacterium]|nr:hypothetical protein [Myxococcales bacterium]
MTPKNRHHCLAASGLALVIAFTAMKAEALEVQGEVGANAVTSTWQGDGGGGGQLRLGTRFWQWLTVDFAGWTQYLRVDQRSTTGLTFGLAATLAGPRLRPTLRVYALHQHEEGLVSVKENPWGTLFGIGAGIRHRAGGGVQVSAEMPIAKARFGEWYAYFGANTT